MRLVPGKAAGESKPEEVPTALCEAVRQYNGSWRTERPLQQFRPPINRYVEDFDELRTTLETVFNILLMFDGSLERLFDACNLAL